MRVLIVSDDPWARAGLAAQLREEAGLEVVGQAASDQDFSLYQPEVVLWDLPPGTTWEEVEVPIVALIAEETRLAQVLAAGARGVLLREAEPEALVAALQAAARGLVVTEPGLVRELIPDPGELEQPPPSDLTPRELEVLQLLAAGLSNKAIARRLDVSEHTAKFHVASILGKLGVESRTEAVVRAAQAGLILL